MTTLDSPSPDLDLIAGVSLRAPQASYELTDLPFGKAELARAYTTSSDMDSLTLSLTAEAAGQCAAVGDSGARTITLSLHEGRSSRGLVADDARLSALRALVVDRALLAHPEALASRSLDGVAPQSPEESLLALLGTLYNEATRSKTRSGLECPACQTHRRTKEQARVAEEQADLRRKMAAATTPREAARIQQAFFERQYQSGRAYSYGYGVAGRQSDCAHIALAATAMSALCARFPEVAFELIGLLAPMGGAAPRFVLGGVMTRVVVPRWLVGRVRSRYDDGWMRRRYGGSRTAVRWTGIRDRARAAKELPPEQRAGVSYAATAWAYDAPLSTLGWTPPTNDVEEAPAPALRDDGEERLEVERVLPAFATKSAKAAPPPKSAAPTKSARNAEPKATRPAVRPPPVKPPAVARPAAASRHPAVTADDFEATRATLLSIGIPEALIDEMVREGRLPGAPRKRR